MRIDALVAILVAALLTSYTLVADYWRFAAAPIAEDEDTCRYDFLTQCQFGRLGEMRHVAAYCNITQADVYEYCALSDTVRSQNLTAVMWLVNRFNLAAPELYAVDGCLPIYEAALRGQVNMVKWLMLALIPLSTDWATHNIRDVMLALEAFCYRDDLEAARWIVTMYCPMAMTNWEIARCARQPIRGQNCAVGRRGSRRMSCSF